MVAVTLFGSGVSGCARCARCGDVQQPCWAVACLCLAASLLLCPERCARVGPQWSSERNRSPGRQPGGSGGGRMLE